MVYSISESTSTNVLPSNPIPPAFQLPEEITETIADLTFTERSLLNYRTFLTILIRKHGLAFKGLKFHPDFPFLSVYHIHNLFRLPKEALCFFWYLFEAYTIGISFNVIKLQSYILQCQFESTPPQSRNLFTLLQWFLPAHQWMRMIPYEKDYVVILFRRPCSFFPPSMVRIEQSIVYHAPTAIVQGYYDLNPVNTPSRLYFPANVNWLNLRSAFAEANMIDPKTIPSHIMKDICAWSNDHPVSSKWIEALDEWKMTHLNVRIDTSGDEEDVDEEEDTEDDGIHFDPYEDDPSHEDSRWK